MIIMNEDEKNLQKFTRFLTYKSSQIIIQSRLGLKIHTKSETDCQQRFFNLTIEDIPEVRKVAKRVICDHSYDRPLCIEISLRTNTGKRMILETWYLNLKRETSDPSTRATYNVYNRMGILLKSLLSVTRLTPAYKLSRGQDPDSYVMCYRMYLGKPQTHHLGADFKEINIGRVIMPIGTIVLGVAYRTEVTIMPSQQSSLRLNKKSSLDQIVIENDHFSSNNCHHNLVITNTKNNINEVNNSKVTVSAAETVIQKVNQTSFAFVDFDDFNQCKNLWSSSLSSSSLWSNDLQKYLLPKANENTELDNEIVLPLSNLCGKKLSDIKALSLSLKNGSVNGNSSQQYQHQQEQQPIDVVDSAIKSSKKSKSPVKSMNSSNCSLNNNEFIVIDYQSSFKKQSKNSCNKKEDLSDFYNDAQNRPILKTFNEGPALYDHVDNLADQLDNLEFLIDELDPDFDNLPSSLHTYWPVFPLD